MANPITDDFTLPLGGIEFHFRWSLREVINMQERLVSGLEVPTIEAIDAGVRSGRLRYIRAMLWAGLQSYQPLLNEDAVTDLMAQASEQEMRAVMSGFGYSTRPDPADVQALGLDTHKTNGNGTGRPQRARAKKRGTTGENSTSSPAALA